GSRACGSAQARTPAGSRAAQTACTGLAGVIRLAARQLRKPFYEPIQLCGIVNAKAKEAEAGLDCAGCFFRA
ncbi:hypothetical protein, partial [Paenibacillus polymyxa]|uniref:hypothetical protein n=1 Tax=Paenibacillus polymyxa TaxID=1406 RepID=UPI001ED8FF6E